MPLENKNILITGGCGFLGLRLAENILKNHRLKTIRVYDNRELAVVEMERKIKDPRLRFLIGDVRDKDRLKMAMNDVDIVIHAAALKHVPVCEFNPIEAIKTNINGAANVIEVALESDVEKVMAISTDKAVCPVNLYGATKMAAEKLFIQANSYKGKRKVLFSCVRYGNVVASSGSVIPLFKEQRKKGFLTITDKRMTRFWITINQGIKFIINSIKEMEGGEIFVPKIPSVKITDLAFAIEPKAEIKVIGIRPGEKIHEELLTIDEARHSMDIGDYFIIYPEQSDWQGGIFSKKGKNLSEGFSYSSGNNNEWLSGENLKRLLEDIEEKRQFDKF
ncbi:MAG: UDP-N-acetylglucosamine 4,6-dehydratase (inverting) [Candidatus Paceibacterota bacterium]|jgi:UDP-N-acetylglucosamine 4,6-dehydratase (inverting)